MALEIRARHNKRGFSKRHSILHDMLRVSLGFGILHQSIGANTGASDAKSLNTLIIDDQIQSLQLAQSYVDVSGLLRQVESTANTTNQVLGEVIARISLVSHGPVRANSLWSLHACALPLWVTMIDAWP